MVKKNKAKSGPSFKADMQAIKKEDVRKLQETFNQFFGAEAGETKKYASKLRNRIYFFGFVVTVFFGLIIYLTKNVNFVGL